MASPTQTGGIDLSSLDGRIAFSAGPSHAEDVYVINADGTGLLRVTSDPAADFDPTWSPDGRRIAYRHQAGDDPTTEIYVTGVDGSGVTNLTNNEGVVDWGPAWSPDGALIAWNSNRDRPGGPLHGFVMDPSGTDVRPFADQIWVEYPAWAPDSTRIAFMAQFPQGTEDYEIFVIDADGTGLRQLTDSPGSDGWPSWSPDGTRILFSSIRDDCSISDAPDCESTGDVGPYHTLYIMNPDGSEQTRLAQRFGQIADWSPDGRFVVFENVDGGGGLLVMATDGFAIAQLPIALPFPAFPDWIA